MDGKAKHAALIVAMTLIVLLVSEVASLLAITLIRDKGIFYQPSISGAYEEYLLIRDELLGWPAPQNLGTHGEYDLSGSRIIPAFDDPATSKNCVSLYGDSFTWSAEVNNESAWSNVLSTLLDCRVGNFGVGGYGSDQAFLRFKKHVNDDAVVVFLNHLSENILRNVNQFHDLLYAGGAGIGFKPRFIVNDSDELELVTLPLFDRGEYERVVLNPERYLTHEYFAPGGASGVSIATFPYTASILRGLRHFHVKTELRNVPWYIDFYNTEHTSGGLEVTARILAAFHAEALAREKTPIVTIIPTGLDLLYFADHAHWPYQSLIDKLSSEEMQVFNFGTGIIRWLDGRDPCILFNHCSKHYNEQGYRQLAELAFALLKDERLLPKIKQQGSGSFGNNQRYERPPPLRDETSYDVPVSLSPAR